MKSHKLIWLIGTLLVVFGCFLPWEQEGDLITYWKYGIQLFPRFTDSGGLFVLLIAIVIGMLSYNLIKQIQKATFWALLLSILLELLSLIFIGSVVMRYVADGSIFGAVTISIGLIMVAVGSLLIFLFAILKYRQMLSCKISGGRRSAKDG